MALLYRNLPSLLLLHQLGRGQCQRASRGIGKISQDWPCDACSLLLLLPQTSSSIPLLTRARFALPRGDRAVSILGGEDERACIRTEPRGLACTFLGWALAL